MLTKTFAPTDQLAALLRRLTEFVEPYQIPTVPAGPVFTVYAPPVSAGVILIVVGNTYGPPLYKTADESVYPTLKLAAIVWQYR